MAGQGDGISVRSAVPKVHRRPRALDYFYRLMGADHLLFGSDHPFGQPYSMVAEMVEQLDCTPAEKEMIYHGNAEGLLGIR